MIPPDPFLLGIILVVLGAAWWIVIGMRSTKAHVLEVLGIVALFLVGIGMYAGTALVMLWHGGH